MSITMGRKSKSAKSSINNLGSKSKKKHSLAVTIEDTNDSVYELGPVPHADPVHRNEGMSSEEGFDEMEKSMLACLDDIPLIQIRR
jgi:hypothetical protein